MKGLKVNMDMVNCVLLIVILVLVVVCCARKNENYDEYMKSLGESTLMNQPNFSGAHKGIRAQNLVHASNSELIKGKNIRPNNNNRSRF